ncbi:hypothetical protein FQR65_LT15192 [Abscondita terminalis]|nr:hypothetical protein FQR65_LT15192 [Abscondita terminalis]
MYWGLLNSGGIFVTVPFDIAAQYDRVELVLFSTVNLTTGSGLRLYAVSRTSAACPEPPPAVSPLFQPVCANTSIVSMSNVDDAQNAVDANFDSYATIRSDAGILVGLGTEQGQLGRTGIDSSRAAGSGVANPDHAININTTDYSEVSLGNVAVGTSVKQYFDFRKLALPSEVINLTLQYGSGALDANLIGGIEIIAYNGVTPVATLDVHSQLINGLNVLGILNNGAKGTIPFAPGVAYDRINVVGLRGVLNVSALPALRDYASRERL